MYNICVHVCVCVHMYVNVDVCVDVCWEWGVGGGEVFINLYFFTGVLVFLSVHLLMGIK
jgi:hypothetical protein